MRKKEGHEQKAGLESVRARLRDKRCRRGDCERPRPLANPMGLGANVGALVADWNPDGPGPDQFCTGTLVGSETLFLTAAPRLTG